MGKFTAVENKTFGRLLVLSQYRDKKLKATYCVCCCSCGNKKTILKSTITRKQKAVLSCGCLAKELSSKRTKEIMTKHGMRIRNKANGFYSSWYCLRRRCNDKSYKNYGGRGITYDPRWNDFLEFKKDMYFSYLIAKRIKYKKEITKTNPLSIERKDVNGNYSKENCIWIPRIKQQDNKRRKAGRFSKPIAVKSN